MEGHVRKRGSKWYYSFESAPIDGKRKRIERVGGKTKKEAEQKLAEAINKYNHTGLHFDPVSVSVADYMDYWLEKYVKRNMKYKTCEAYENDVKKHIKPGLGNYRLAALQPDTIQDWVDGIKDEGYAKNTIANILECLSGALEYAVLPLKYIRENPCHYVKIGKVEESLERQEYREYICSKEDFGKIIERFGPDTNFYIPLMLGYHLGTRIGETYGFDLMRDVDFAKSEISVNRQIRKENKKWYYRPPKYGSSRTIKMGKTISEILKAEIQKKKENMLRYGRYYMKSYCTADGKIIQAPADRTMGPEYKEIMPVSTRESGKILTPISFQYCAKIVHRELGNNLFHSHCLRHTHGTILAENGVSPKTVMERLGHKNIQTTLQTYIFNTEKMQDDSVEIFEQAIK